MVNYITQEDVIKMLESSFIAVEVELRSALTHDEFMMVKNAVDYLPNHRDYGPSVVREAAVKFHKAMCSVTTIMQCKPFHSADLKQLLCSVLDDQGCIIEWRGVFSEDDWYQVAKLHNEQADIPPNFKLPSTNRMVLFGYKAGLLECYRKIHLGVSGKDYVLVPLRLLKQLGLTSNGE